MNCKSVFGLLQFGGLIGVTAAGLLLSLSASQSQRPERSPVLVEAEDRLSHALDLELRQATQLHQDIQQVMRRLQNGSLSLAQAVGLVERRVEVDYPKFLRFVEITFHGTTRRQTIAHYLVRRAIALWGVPSVNAQTTQLLHEYERLFQPDARAQAVLRDYIDGWTPSGPLSHPQPG